jgi:hypothetical protein
VHHSIYALGDLKTLTTTGTGFSAVRFLVGFTGPL